MSTTQKTPEVVELEGVVIKTVLAKSRARIAGVQTAQVTFMCEKTNMRVSASVQTESMPFPGTRIKLRGTIAKNGDLRGQGRLYVQTRSASDITQLSKPGGVAFEPVLAEVAGIFSVNYKENSIDFDPLFDISHRGLFELYKKMGGSIPTSLDALTSLCGDMEIAEKIMANRLFSVSNEYRDAISSSDVAVSRYAAKRIINFVKLDSDGKPVFDQAGLPVLLEEERPADSPKRRKKGGTTDPSPEIKPEDVITPVAQSLNIPSFVRNQSGFSRFIAALADPDLRRMIFSFDASKNISEHPILSQIIPVRFSIVAALKSPASVDSLVCAAISAYSADPAAELAVWNSEKTRHNALMTRAANAIDSGELGGSFGDVVHPDAVAEMRLRVAASTSTLSRYLPLHEVEGGFFVTGRMLQYVSIINAVIANDVELDPLLPPGLRSETLMALKAEGFDDQQVDFADAVLFGGQPIILLDGTAGSGKSTIIERVMKTLRDHEVRVALLTPTGKSAARLGGGAQTYHSYFASDSLTRDYVLPSPREPLPTWQSRIRSGVKFISPNPRFSKTLSSEEIIANQLSGGPGVSVGSFQMPTVTCTDEASMLSAKHGSLLLEAVARSEGARIILAGDSGQLKSVEPGSMFADLCALSSLGLSDYVPSLRHVHLVNDYRATKQLSAATKNLRYNYVEKRTPFNPVDFKIDHQPLSLSLFDKTSFGVMPDFKDVNQICESAKQMLLDGLFSVSIKPQDIKLENADDNSVRAPNFIAESFVYDSVMQSQCMFVSFSNSHIEKIAKEALAKIDLSPRKPSSLILAKTFTSSVVSEKSLSAVGSPFFYGIPYTQKTNNNTSLIINHAAESMVSVGQKNGETWVNIGAHYSPVQFAIGRKGFTFYTTENRKLASESIPDNPGEYGSKEAVESLAEKDILGVPAAVIMGAMSKSKNPTDFNLLKDLLDKTIALSKIHEKLFTSPLPSDCSPAHVDEKFSEMLKAQNACESLLNAAQLSVIHRGNKVFLDHVEVTLLTVNLEELTKFRTGKSPKLITRPTPFFTSTVAARSLSILGLKDYQSLLKLLEENRRTIRDVERKIAMESDPEKVEKLEKRRDEIVKDSESAMKDVGRKTSEGSRWCKSTQQNLGACFTVHTSQGSQSPYVVYIFDPDGTSKTADQTRELAFTAITRAQKGSIICSVGPIERVRVPFDVQDALPVPPPLLHRMLRYEMAPVPDVMHFEKHARPTNGGSMLRTGLIECSFDGASYGSHIRVNTEAEVLKQWQIAVDPTSSNAKSAADSLFRPNPLVALGDVINYFEDFDSDQPVSRTLKPGVASPSSNNLELSIAPQAISGQHQSTSLAAPANSNDDEEDLDVEGLLNSMGL